MRVFVAKKSKGSNQRKSKGVKINDSDPFDFLNPKLIILDEPTSSLDRTVQFQVIELLRTLQDQQKLTYLFISHDLKVVRSMAHDVIVMKQGKIIEQGADVFKNPQHEYTKELVECAFL